MKSQNGRGLGWLAFRVALVWFNVIGWVFVAGPVSGQVREDVSEAKTGNEPRSETTVIEETPISESDRNHWAYQPVRRPELPDVRDPSTTVNAIDRLVRSRLERKDLPTLGMAHRRILLRRLAFDLTGLPPSQFDMEVFVADERVDAYDRVVDRLLATPEHAEHWALHWLDLARFAESDGFEHDLVRPDAWRYRDWVVSAIDHDMSYNEFIRRQIAGDLLSDRPESIATGFCLSGPDMPDMNLQEERRHNLLNEMTSTVGSALLGLQFHCAQCHDHKYDPLSQGDFYRLRAFFEASVQVQRDKSVKVLAESVRAATNNAESKSVEPISHVYIRGDWRRRGAEVRGAFPRIVTAALGPSSTVHASSGSADIDMGKDSNGDASAAKSADSMAAARLQLANWLTSPTNPLATRVAVNRIWMHHFGEGLCRTPNDFGVMGDTPVHDQLLDWLASEFVSSDGADWSSKRFHRLIVLSTTYQTASHPIVEARDGELPAKKDDGTFRRLVEADPSNRLLGRFARRRLDGETIRDTMLAAAGILNKSRGGAGVFAPLPQELRDTLLKNQWPTSMSESANNRRSIYLFARRNLRYPMFDVFDRPDANATCPQRNRSTTALQSLTLLNSEFSWQIARTMSQRIAGETGSNWEDRIQSAFMLTLLRGPTDDEREAAVELIRKEANGEEALSRLCLALFNLHEFVYAE